MGAAFISAEALDAAPAIVAWQGFLYELLRPFYADPVE